MKKRVFSVALVLCLIATVGFGTLAYFKASKNVTNYFQVAGYDPTKPDEPIDPEKLFSITLEETDITKDDGSTTDTGNTYTNILPGDTLTKDPTITNTGKYDAWVRVKVEVTDYTAWATACVKHEITDLAAIFNNHDASLWSRGEADESYNQSTDTYTYVYYYNNEVAPEGEVTLFESVTIPAAFDIDDMSSLSAFQIKITGEAIQAANTGDNAKDAFRTYWE